MRSGIKQIVECIAVCIGVFLIASTPRGAIAQDAANLPYMNPELSPEQRAIDLVHRMTLEEKATQMQNNASGNGRLYSWPALPWVWKADGQR